jgi:branched-chain amino acid transport system substrate-binding protein
MAWRKQAMGSSHRHMSRRQLVQGLAVSGLAATQIARPAVAVPRTIRIGLVQPSTGPLAFFTQQIAFTLEQVKKATSGAIKINGARHPFEIVVKDSQSNPNRAAEVAQELILQDKIDIMATYATPETVNPVSDQCELNGIPVVSNDAPLEPYFFGRKGDPKKGFEWTYHFFFSGRQLAQSVVPYWDRLPTDKIVGGLWPNDGDGIAFSRDFPPYFASKGYKSIDPGRFDMPASDYTAQITAFKAANADIVQGVLPPPEFTTFWNGTAQQGYKPKIVHVGKACEFPEAIYVLGERANRLTTEVWWSKFHPFHSGLSGQSSLELAEAWEKASNKQWSLPLGFRHALFEVLLDVLKRTSDLDKPESIRDAIRTTNYKSMVGSIDFTTGPFPNTAQTPLVMGQWFKGKKYPYEMSIVDNSTAPDISTNAAPELIA